MNAFKVLNSNNEAIPINKLDGEACTLWNREVSNREYACPSNESMLNWFDMIGYRIAYQSNYYTLNTWLNVKHALFMSVLEGRILDRATGNFKLNQEYLEFIEQYTKPYIDLINHWESLGYTPLQIIQ